MAKTLLNDATKREIQGILSERLASRIIDARDDSGPFESWADMTDRVLYMTSPK